MKMEPVRARRLIKPENRATEAIQPRRDLKARATCPIGVGEGREGDSTNKAPPIEHAEVRLTSGCVRASPE